MRERLGQLPMFPGYEAKGVDYLTLGVAARALGRVTLNRSYKLIRRPGEKVNHAAYQARSQQIQDTGGLSRETLFREVTCRMKAPAASIAPMIGRLYGSVEDDDPEELAMRCIEALKRHIAHCWVPEKTHIVMHSSGYDSRLLSRLIFDISQERGGQWLGATAFVCFQPEIERAEAVFEHVWRKAEGPWPAVAWTPVDPLHDPVDYYAPALDFRVVGGLSETERFWGGALLSQLTLQASGWLEDDVQGVSGLFADETGKWNRKAWGDLGWLIGCHLLDAPGIFPSAPHVEWICPYIGQGWLSLLTTYRIPERVDAFKRRMLRILDPELEALPNWRFEAKAMRDRNGGHLDQQKLSLSTQADMDDAYRISWYASEAGPASLDYASDPVFRYWDDKNTHYMKAAICERLIGEGVEVSV